MVLEKAMHSILAPNESPRPYGPHGKTSSTKRSLPTDDKLRKKGSQISKELSDLVVYVQVRSSIFNYFLVLTCGFSGN